MDIFKIFSTKKTLTEEEKQKYFYKKLRISSKTPETEAHKKILAYVSKNKDLDRVFLTKKQQNDAVFMLGLYKANPKIYQYFKPLPELQENLFYIKTVINTIVHQVVTPTNSLENTLIELLEPLDISLKNMKFIEELMDLYPDADMFGVLNSVLIEQNNKFFKDDDRYSLFVNILNNLPRSYFEAQAKNVGVKALEFLPFNHKYYLGMAEIAVKKEGFGAIKLLPVHFVKDNINLLYSASKKDGVNALYTYLMFDLNPKNLPAGKERSELREIRHKILNDRKINDLLNNEFFITNHMTDLLDNI